MKPLEKIKPIMILLICIMFSACGGDDGVGSGKPANTQVPAVWGDTNWDNMTWQ